MSDANQRSATTVEGRPDYDHFAPADRPQDWFYDEWDARRAQCPVSHSSQHGGFYLLTRYDDVAAALTDTETFTSSQGAAIPPQPFQFIPEDIDPPRHRQYRTIINAALSPQAVAEHEPWIRAQAVKLLDPLVGRDEFDLIAAFAGPFPREVAMRLIGIPTADLAQISQWTEILTFTPRDSEEGQQAGAALFEYLGQLVVARRDQPPSDDLISLIVRGEVDGELLSPLEMMSYVALLLFGGLHTTTHAIAGFLAWLGEHDDDRHQLTAEPARIATVIDEALRYTSPSSHLGRVATRDVEVAGCPIPAGSRVMVSLGAANFDPERYESPRELRLDRGAMAHAAFGLGPHRCVGSHLAKLQMRIAYEEFLARFPDFHVRDLGELRYAGAEVRGLTTVPLVVER